MLKRIMIVCVLGFISMIAMEKDQLSKNQQKTLFFIAPAAETPQFKDLLSDIIKDIAGRGVKVSWINDLPAQLDMNSRYVRTLFMRIRGLDFILLRTDGDLSVRDKQVPREALCMTTLDYPEREGRVTLSDSRFCLDKLMETLPHFIQK